MFLRREPFFFLFFLVEQSQSKLKVGQNSRRFGVIFLSRCEDKRVFFLGVFFCRENSTVILEDFFENLRPFLWGLPKNIFYLFFLSGLRNLKTNFSKKS
jgi:hypothetical protein